MRSNFRSQINDNGLIPLFLPSLTCDTQQPLAHCLVAICLAVRGGALLIPLAVSCLTLTLQLSEWPYGTLPLAITSLSLQPFCPHSHACYSDKIGGVHLGLPRKAPRNWVLLLFRLLEPMSLSGNWKLTQPAKWHCRNRAVMSRIN